MSGLLSRARTEGTPLIDGETATFVWQGPQAPALVGDFNGWGGSAEGRTLAPIEWEVWGTTISLPRDAYMEYHYRDDAAVLDPFNRHTVPDGLGGRHNYFYMPDAAPTLLTRSLADVPHGQVTRHVLYNDHLIVGGRRTVHLYHPPVEQPCPLLIVFDGDEYLKRARLPQILDNLIAQGRIQPLAAAFVNHGRSARFVEYMCSDAQLAFLFLHVLPLAQQHLNLIDVSIQPGAYGACGASMGGLISLYTGIRAPEVFGHVLSQSGAFGFDLMGENTLVHELLRRDAGTPIHVYLDVGRYEFLLEANRHMYALLGEKGYDVTLHEANGSHNYTSWRNDVWRGLETLFPPRTSSG